MPHQKANFVGSADWVAMTPGFLCGVAGMLCAIGRRIRQADNKAVLLYGVIASVINHSDEWSGNPYLYNTGTKENGLPHQVCGLVRNDAEVYFAVLRESCVLSVDG